MYVLLLCALCVRVKILSVPNRGNRLFFSVLVWFIDVGKEEEVKSYRILQLPEQFHSLPGQAVEIIVCRVKPADSETNWHPKVSHWLPHFALTHITTIPLFDFLHLYPQQSKLISLNSEVWLAKSAHYLPFVSVTNPVLFFKSQNLICW